MISEQQASAAVNKLRAIIEAAENSNQAGEDAAVMAATASELYYSLSAMVITLEDYVGETAAIQSARAALAKARGAP